MSTAARFNNVVCLTVLVGTITFCVADGRPLMVAISLPVVFAGWLFGRGERPKPGSPPIAEPRPLALPRTLVNLLVLAAIINAAMHAGGARSAGQPIVSHLGEFLIYVQLLKLFDRRTVRDESQLLTLSVFVAIASVLTSNNLGTGLGLVLYTPLAVTATMLYQIRAGRDRVLGAESTSPSTPDDPVATDGRFSRHFRRTMGVSLAATAALASVVFILTPRGLGMGAFGQFGQPHGEIGFNDQLTLGRAGMLSESPTPVLDLSVRDEAGNNLGSPTKMYYLRGVVRDEYVSDSALRADIRDGRGVPRSFRGDNGEERPPDHIWVRSRKTDYAMLDFDPGRPTVFPVEREIAPVTNKLIQRITIRSSVASEAYVFACWRPLSILTQDSLPLGARIKYDPADSTIRRERGASPMFTYVIESDTSEIGASRPPTSPLGFQSGRIHDLAVSILQSRNIPYPLPEDGRVERRQAANALREHLRKTCSYSLDLWAPIDNEDPLETFIFRKQTGHCEYFASAFVALCQSVGIHARIVGGFVAAEYNTLTGSYVVRQSNAHAWAEYYLGNGAWATTDPSPSGEIERIHRAPTGWLSSVRRWWDTLEFGWNRSIVSFDSAKQSDALGGSDRDGLSSWFAAMSDRISRGRFTGNIRQLIPAWAFAIVPVLMLLLALAIAAGRLTRRGRLRSAARDGGAPDKELRALLADAAFYEQTLRALERAGPSLEKPLSTPPLAHAHALAAGHPGPARALETIGRLFYEVRFGRRRLSSDQLDQAREALAELRAALRS